MASSPPTREDVMAAYGEAMLAAQQFEEAVVGLLGATGEVDAVNASSDGYDVMKRLDAAQQRWDPLFKKTAGQLRNLLGDDDGLADMPLAVDARNLLAHHYLRDHITHLASQDGRKDMLDRLHDTAKQFRAIGASFDRLRLARMSVADLADDHITTPREARSLRYYDPDVDDAVPPEPFGA
jgi:hypothetical protein